MLNLEEAIALGIQVKCQQRKILLGGEGNSRLQKYPTEKLNCLLKPSLDGLNRDSVSVHD